MVVNIVPRMSLHLMKLLLSITLYYLPRRDRVYLTSDGVFTVKTGIPGDNPVLPDPIPNSMSVANVSLPAYLYNVNDDADVDFVDHKRYQMSDIA